LNQNNVDNFSPNYNIQRNNILIFAFKYFKCRIVEEYKRSEEGHYFSDEDFLFNLKWYIWELYMQGYSNTYIIENKQEKYSVYSIEVEIELERIKRSFKRVNL
jgi:hypothetical protein